MQLLGRYGRNAKVQPANNRYDCMHMKYHAYNNRGLRGCQHGHFQGVIICI